MFHVIVFLLFLEIRRPAPFQAAVMMAVLHHQFVRVKALPLPFRIKGVIYPIHRVAERRVQCGIAVSCPQAVRQMALDAVPAALHHPLVILPFHDGARILPVIPSPVPVFRHRFEFFHPLFYIFVPFHDFCILLRLFRVDILPLRQPLRIILGKPIRLVQKLLVILKNRTVHGRFHIRISRLIKI